MVDRDLDDETKRSLLGYRYRVVFSKEPLATAIDLSYRWVKVFALAFIVFAIAANVTGLFGL